MAAHTVSAVPGDPRPLLPSVVSSLIDSPLAVFSLDNTASAPVSPLHEPGFAFAGQNSLVLHDPLSVSRYLIQVAGGSALLPSDWSTRRVQIEQWLEWEQAELLPAAYVALRTGKPLPEALVAKLADALKGSSHVVPDGLSLADVAIWSTLFPLSRSLDASSPVSKWFLSLEGTPAFAVGVAKASTGATREALIAGAKHLASATSDRAEAKAPPSSMASGQSGASSLSRRAKQSPQEAAPGGGVPKWTALANASREARGIRLPQKGQRNIMVTSALPYVNNVPHLGNIIGCVLSADVYVRFCRRRGHNVIYMCGTDEYGTATETKAMEEGVTPREICDKYHAIHKDIYEWFDIDFDKFGRTSTPQQTEICQAMFKSLLNKNRLFEDTMEQPFCDTCQRFLADRFVEGTCPTPGCGYEDARGDQCDKCGKLLNPTDLINPRCKVCNNPPRIRQTEHMFLDLPALKGELEKYVAETSTSGGWSANSVQTTSAWMRDGLKPRCITRDLKWGVPVPLEKYKEKVFYVWFDAPIGYISITANYTGEWKQWWQSPKDVELVQFMGKDNVPFHTVIFPCTLLGTGEPWTMMRTISVCEYLNYEDGKFSKSRGVGVFGNDAKSTGIPSEVWRYYLLTNRPEVSDTQFTWKDLQAKQNNELLKNLGNFINRTLSFLAKPAGEGYGSVVPDAVSPESDEVTMKMAEEVGKLVREYVEVMEKVKLKSGLRLAMAISSQGNAYLQDSQFWKLYKEDRPRCDVVVRSAVGLVHLLTTVLEPYMPSFSYKVLAQLDMPPSSLVLSDADVARTARPWEIIPKGHKVGRPEVLFTEMKDAEAEELRTRFAGNQAERKATEARAPGGAAPAASTSGKTPLLSAEGKASKEKGGNKKGVAPKGDAKAGDEGKGKGGEAKGKGEPKAKKDVGEGAAEPLVDVSRLDIRVGLIKKAWLHPNAESLYVEEIDVGEPEPRQVVSGLVKFVPLEQMQQRKVLVLCNLKPATMRSIKSHAMVMAASNADHTQVELVQPPEGAKIGERVTFPGYPGEPDAQLNPKKKIWEAVQPSLNSGKDLIAYYKESPFTTSTGVCTVASIAEGSIA